MVEMSACGRRIVKITQRDPAGHEIHLGSVGLARRRCGLVHHLIGGLILLLIEQLSGENAPLAPPLIRLLQSHGVRTRLQNDAGRVGNPVLAHQPLGTAEDEAEILAGVA